MPAPVSGLVQSFVTIFASNLPRSVLRNGELLPRSLIERDRMR
jgi:hypothetical protein